MDDDTAEYQLYSCTASEANAEMQRRCEAVDRALGAAMILDWSGHPGEALDVLAPAVLTLSGDPRASSAIERLEFQRFGDAAAEFVAVVAGALAYANRLKARIDADDQKTV